MRKLPRGRAKEIKMSANFAETIMDSMVDESGHCGERGLSEKQFHILSKDLREMETKNAGGWGTRSFTSTDYEGFIGKYEVKLNKYVNFNPRFTVVSIDKWCDEVPDSSNSEYVGEIKQRVQISAMCVSVKEFNTDYGTRHCYTFVDGNGNAYVWFASEYCDWFDDSASDDEDPDRIACPGSVVTLKGSVKAHKEYKGAKQTILTRCKVLSIEERWL